MATAHLSSSGTSMAAPMRQRTSVQLQHKIHRKKNKARTRARAEHRASSFLRPLTICSRNSVVPNHTRTPAFKRNSSQLRATAPSNAQSAAEHGAKPRVEFQQRVDGGQRVHEHHGRAYGEDGEKACGGGAEEPNSATAEELKRARWAAPL
nr:unnamed protein product [Digitaria exilis]